VPILVDYVLIIYNLLFFKDGFHCFKDIKYAGLYLFELLDLDIQESFVFIACMHVGTQDNVPMSVGHGEELRMEYSLSRHLHHSARKGHAGKNAEACDDHDNEERCHPGTD